ncbi:MAG: RNA polymerase sigma factor [Acidobacteriaceae bacterium]|nr:RNA polymerase sigma factor [Acidobacteriaceae bacterium]
MSVNNSAFETRELALIGQICAGEAENFECLIQPHIGMLRSMVARMVFNTFDVEDVMQQTLLKAYTNLHTFRFASTFRTWLISIAVNEVRQYRRQRFSMQPPSYLEEASLQVLDHSDTPSRAMERKESARLIHSTLEKLPPKYRIVIELLALRGLSTAETADQLKVSINCVKSRYFRARRRIALLLTRSNKLKLQSN